jgi:hypothetical protein
VYYNYAYGSNGYWDDLGRWIVLDAIINHPAYVQQPVYGQPVYGQPVYANNDPLPGVIAAFLAIFVGVIIIAFVILIG